MKPLIPIFVLFLFAGSASCENFINLTIYNNLNYTLVITDIEYHGICTDCQERLLEPCKTTNLFVTTRMLFMDVHLKYKAYRHYPGKPNDMNNIRLHQAISSSYDLIPHKENCLDDILRYKRSLVVLRNSRGETPNLCYDRFVDISDEIEKVFCKFEDWEH